jgi:hypothetical protein
VCKCLLANASSRCGKQFEKRPVSEKIQVFGVRMRSIEETLARRSLSGPTIIEPGQSLIV